MEWRRYTYNYFIAFIDVFALSFTQEATSQLCTQLQQGQTRTIRTPAFRDTLRRPMIAHTSDSHQIPSENKTKSKLQIFKKMPKFEILQETLMRHTV